jgi:HAD superfamily hydrolase (TIGR01484 family)
MKPGPRPIRDIPQSRCAGLRLLFTDLDDTMTEGGLLPASSFECLWALAAAGVRAVVVTGRPAGWCDHIARMWPVAAVVGENGALVYAYDRERRRMDRAYLIPEAERLEGQRRLARIRERVLREVPACAIAADQPFRLADLAIDYREDAGPLGDEEVHRLCRIIESEGASYKISSIHINCWYGDFDKVRGVRRFLADRGHELEKPEVQDSSLFIGDSPNDEPLFRALAASIGVANIRPFLDRMQSPPTYLTERPAAAGFAEAVGIILARR